MVVTTSSAEEVFTFEASNTNNNTAKSILEQIQTPNIARGMNGEFSADTPELLKTPASTAKPTSPLALKFSQEASTPKDRTDFNYLNQLSPMPGSWVVKQEETFKNEDPIRYEEYLNDSTQNSPISINRNTSETPMTGEYMEGLSDDEGTSSVSPLKFSKTEKKIIDSNVKSPIPSIPTNEVKTNLNGSAFNKISSFSQALTDALGISSKKEAEKELDINHITQDSSFQNANTSEGDTTMATLKTSELLYFTSEKANYSRHSSSASLSDQSSVSESNFIDIDGGTLDFPPPPPPNALNLTSEENNNDLDKTPVNSNFYFDEAKTPTIEDAGNFATGDKQIPTENMNTDFAGESQLPAGTRIISSRAASPLMATPIYEEDDEALEAEARAHSEADKSLSSLSSPQQQSKLRIITSPQLKDQDSFTASGIQPNSPTLKIPPRRRPRTSVDMIRLEQSKNQENGLLLAKNTNVDIVGSKLEMLNFEGENSAPQESDKHLSTSSSIYTDSSSMIQPGTAIRSTFGFNHEAIIEENETEEPLIKDNESHITEERSSPLTQVEEHQKNFDKDVPEDNNNITEEETKEIATESPLVIKNPINTASVLSFDLPNRHMSTTSSVYPLQSPVESKFQQTLKPSREQHFSTSSSIYPENTSPVTARFPQNEKLSIMEEADEHEDISQQPHNLEESAQSNNQKKARVSVKPSLYQSTIQQRAALPDSRSYTSNKNSMVATPVSKTTFSSSLMDEKIAASHIVNQVNSPSSEFESPSDNINSDGDEEEDDEEDDESALFVTSIYSFDSSNLESDGDASICLSFNSEEIAFTYSLDDSGWGEVTLINSLKRGWVPMNYFRPTLLPSSQQHTLSGNAGLAASKTPLRKLFKAAGQFLLNTQSKPIYDNDHALKGFTFDINYINAISDGVKALLNDTGCLSRTNNIIQSKPLIRKLRKKLLRDWYDLVLKAKDYNHTFDVTKIELLQLMTYQVLRKAISYLEIWGIESEDVTEQENKENIAVTDRQLKGKARHISFLETPPHVMIRINEVHTHLISYLALITGRLDLVEHNSQGCQLVEEIADQIMLLVNELQYIGKVTVSMLPPNYEPSKNQLPLQTQKRILDTNNLEMDKLLNELNENIKALADVANRRNISNNINGNSQRNKVNRKGTIRNGNNPDLFFYTKEGGSVVYSACKMIGFISSSAKIIKSFVVVTKDFELPSSRKYPDFMANIVSPSYFLKKASSSLAHDKDVSRQVKNYRKLQSPQLSNSVNSPKPFNNRASKRFSMFRSGKAGDMELTDDGLDFLSGIAPASTPFITDDGTFDEFLDKESPDTNKLSNSYASPQMKDDTPLFNPEDEIIRDSNKKSHILGISFKSLVYLLTDEMSTPDYFFISTFFLTFRIFSSGSVLLEELVSRFDVNNKVSENEKKYGNGNNNNNKTMFSSLDSRMINRRKLVCKTFQLWLESYWKPKTDYILLAPLINFFNEGVKEHLPMVAANLIEIASKLVGQPPIESTKSKLDYYNNIDNDHQLVPRMISPTLHKKHISKHLSRLSFTDMLGEMEMHNSFLDDIDTYDLAKVSTRNSMSSAVTSRKSLNLGLGSSLKNSETVALISAQQLDSIRKLVVSYRNMLKDHWVKNINLGVYSPLPTEILIESWWLASQESWNILNQDLALLNFNGLEIAKQLTLIESKIFCSIKVEELLNQNFTSKKLHLNLSPNIQRSVLFTNLLSDYVIESILQPKLTIRQRVHAVKCWLKISISCLYLCNFNSLASIITSLQSFLISRITKIWEELPEKYKDLFEYLTSIIHPDKNYLVYRNKLKEFLSSDVKEGLEIPVVPYLSLFLQDLTFVVDGNSNYRTNTKSFLNQKLINMDKYFKITTIIADIQSLQIPYKDIGELGDVYNKDTNIDLKRSNTIKHLKEQQVELGETDNDIDMFDIAGVPALQELIMLEVWKVKQINLKEDDRAWKLSCVIQPRDQQLD